MIENPNAESQTKTGSPSQEARTAFYSNRQTVNVWGALVVLVGGISGGASLAQHSFTLTASLLVGTIAVWYVGYWALSESYYFISPTKAGFNDRFRSREVQFDEIRSVTKESGKYSSSLKFACKTRSVTIPLDPMVEGWFNDVKGELLKRGIPFSSTAFGFPN